MLSWLADVTRATLYPRPDEILRLEIISKLEGELTKHLDIESTGKRVLPDEIFLIDDANVKCVLLTVPGEKLLRRIKNIIPCPLYRSFVL